jgi:acetylornithine/succinyldiaminopimelate/putrescine aminotransferase
VLVHPIRGNSDARPFQGRTWHDAMMELRDLRNFCTHHDITLIFDEVQTGSGRTGAYTYGQAIGVRPDILTLGKGIAMGVPMGAMLARGEYANVFTPGTHFSTFGGNPLCCQFLEQMLGWLQTPGNLDQVNDLGRLIVNEIRKMKHVSNARAQGMLIAADLDIDNKVLATRCQDKGLLIGCFRPVLKLTPPLNISMAELSKGLSILASCLEAM